MCICVLRIILRPLRKCLTDLTKFMRPFYVWKCFEGGNLKIDICRYVHLSSKDYLETVKEMFD